MSHNKKYKYMLIIKIKYEIKQFMYQQKFWMDFQ